MVIIILVVIAKIALNSSLPRKILVDFAFNFRKSIVPRSSSYINTFEREVIAVKKIIIQMKAACSGSLRVIPDVANTINEIHTKINKITVLVLYLVLNSLFSSLESIASIDLISLFIYNYFCGYVFIYNLNLNPVLIARLFIFQLLSFTILFNL
jgi:hypothetical protein